MLSKKTNIVLVGWAVSLMLFSVAAVTLDYLNIEGLVKILYSCTDLIWNIQGVVLTIFTPIVLIAFLTIKKQSYAQLKAQYENFKNRDRFISILQVLFITIPTMICGLYLGYTYVCSLYIVIIPLNILYKNKLKTLVGEVNK